MNKFIAFVALCFVASASAGPYGSSLIGPGGLIGAGYGANIGAAYGAPNANLADWDLPSYAAGPAANYATGLNIAEPELIIPNIIAPGYGVSALGYGAHNAVGAINSASGYGVLRAAPGLIAGPIVGPNAAIANLRGINVRPAAPALAPAVSITSGVRASSAASSSHSSKVQNVGYAAPRGGHQAY